MHIYDFGAFLWSQAPSEVPLSPFSWIWSLLGTFGKIEKNRKFTDFSKKYRGRNFPAADFFWKNQQQIFFGKICDFFIFCEFFQSAQN